MFGIIVEQTARQRVDLLGRAFQGGDRGAFEELARLMSGRLARLGGRITGDVEEGSDIAQEALVRGFRSIDRWDGRGSLVSWLYRIATNLAIDRLRRPAVSAPEPVPAAGPVERSAGAERRDAVQRALARLTEKQRVAVVLKHFEGLTLAEIAEIRGCQIGTVKATLFQAFEKLRPLLAAVAEDRA